MKKTLAGTLVTIAGAVLGVIVSRSLAQMFGFAAWAVFLGVMIGAFFGASTAWAGTDVPHFVNGIKRAWNVAVSWKPDPMHWQAWRRSVVFHSILYTQVILFAVGVIWMTEGGIDANPVPYLAPIVFVIVLFGIVPSELGFLDYWRKVHNDPSKSEYGVPWKVYLKRNIPSWYKATFIYGLLLLIRGVRKVLLDVPELARGFALGARSFARWTFFFVHTRARRCAFIGAGIGTIVGVASGYNVAIAAAVGSVIFLLEYEFVGKRLLGRIPV